MSLTCGKRQSRTVGAGIMRKGPAIGGQTALKRLLNVSLLGSFVLLTGCPYYVAPAGTVVMIPASFDRSFAAASGAMRDEGLTITTQDSASGIIVGGRDGTTVTASVRQQADGSVVVQFHSGDEGDPTLLQRVSQSYDRRMGR
ncbi:hypothetical protein [Paraburkholderia sp. J11-2]|uniref:hypothetical protein n=1 Tax=Paraburkholderia sp. J11-2 TaxID=2805431 RepID=UPI002AB7CFEA|nr:hypothetical protein [Paraburkholderia sp. J11-2]